MSPTEPHVYLTLDDVHSLFSDELLSSGATSTRQLEESLFFGVFSETFFFKESEDTLGQMYKKQSTNFIILSLQRHKPLYPRNISLKKQKKIDFWLPYTDRRNGKGSDRMTQGIPTIEKQRHRKTLWGTKWYDGQTRQDGGGCTWK